MADNFNTLDLSCCDVAATKQVQAIVGRNPDVDSGTDEDVWTPGGDFDFDAVDAATEIFSDNAADTAAGTGAQSIRIRGLSGGVITDETVAMNGVTPVALSNQYNRIFFTEIVTVGTGGSNTGTLTIQQTVGPVLLGNVLPEVGNVLNGFFTVPDNWNPAQLTNLAGSIGKQAASFMSIILQFRRPGGGWTTGVILDVNTQGSSIFNFPLVGETSSLLLPSGYDARARTSGANTTNNGVTVNMTFSEA